VRCNHCGYAYNHRTLDKQCRHCGGEL
jgi:hypothetical protein